MSIKRIIPLNISKDLTIKIGKTLIEENIKKIKDKIKESKQDINSDTSE